LTTISRAAESFQRHQRAEHRAAQTIKTYAAAINSLIATIGDKNVRQITRDLDDCYAPSMSADGSRVVFASTKGGGQNIWVINADGTNPVQLTHDTRDNVDPVFSPDGSRISYTTTVRGDGDLMVMNADGSNVRRVTQGINVEGRNSWAPDGHSLSFYAGPVGDKDIYIVEEACTQLPNGCGLSQLRRVTRGGNNKAPDFSPDGQWITFASELDTKANEVFIVRVDGTELFQLTFEGKADWQPRWGWHP
jgi:TolB protein